MARIPVSTYRLQLHGAFRLADASAIVPYLERLGIGDVYASPLLTARPGSQHGYDVTDPTRVNPEIGGDVAFEELTAALRERDMGLLLDIVPNHMSSSLENPWWRDVLRNGQSSDYARFFDIDWRSETPGLAGKVLLPVLGAPFRDVLESGELSLGHDGREYVIRYYENHFPVSTDSVAHIPFNETPEKALNAVNGVAGVPESFDGLEALVLAQNYRLAYWRVAADSINYRRFFDVSDLVSLRAEDRAVFEATHQRIVELACRGDVTGVRIDHIDGLLDPKTYLEWLQEALPEQSGSFYVAVEKILASDEELPADWLTAGTSGYDFLNVLNGVFVERRSTTALDRTYARLRGAEDDFEELVYQRKHQVMADLFPGDIKRLADDLWSIGAGLRAGVDLTHGEIRQAMVEAIAHFQVYRTYTISASVSLADRARIEAAVAAARERMPELERPLSVFKTVVLLDYPEHLDAEERQRWLAFVMRWQQFTGPIMAKGFEDTSLYVYNRLISLNEVGGEPDPSGVPLADLHTWAQHRQQRWNGAISATSTHDTKRSEDVRARINVLSELAPEWDTALAHWQDCNRSKKAMVGEEMVPDGNVDHLIYHSMLGAWPFHDDEITEFRERLKQYLLKASREAKTHTSWIDQNTAYEEALTGFVDRILVEERDDPFMLDFMKLQKVTAFQGALNSLSQTLLKTTMPGVPDFYQGTELWDLSLVDPDNRRPVDYELRMKLLDELSTRDEGQPLEDLMADWTSGMIKLYVTWKALGARRFDPELFEHGEYLSLQPSGQYGRHVVAFARNHVNRWAIAAAPRLTITLARARDLSFMSLPLGEPYWREMTIDVPEASPDVWTNVSTGEVLDVSNDVGRRVLRLEQVFSSFPVALLVGECGVSGV